MTQLFTEDWQPIDTAPRDHPVMLWSTTEKFLPGAIWSEPRGTWLFVVFFGLVTRCYEIADATHWLPIPAPPVAA